MEINEIQFVTDKWNGTHYICENDLERAELFRVFKQLFEDNAPSYESLTRVDGVDAGIEE